MNKNTENQPEEVKPDSEANAVGCSDLLALIKWARSGESTGGARTQKTLDALCDVIKFSGLDFDALMIRREIATLEWVTACANHDLGKYGEWQCNWAALSGEIQMTLDKLMARARSKSSIS